MGNLFPKRTVPSTKLPTKFGINRYRVVGSYWDPQSQTVKRADFGFTLPELTDRETGFQREFRAVKLGRTSEFLIDLGSDPRLGLNRYQRLTAHMIRAGSLDILNQARINPDSLVMHELGKFDPNHNLHIQSGNVVSVASPTIKLDPRLLDGSVRLNSNSLPADLTIYYALHTDAHGNTSVVLHPSVQRLVTDFDGDKLKARLISGTLSNGRTVSQFTGFNYPLLGAPVRWKLDPDWSPSADIALIGSRGVGSRHERSVWLQADAIRAESAKLWTREESLAALRAKQVPDIIGSINNRLNAEAIYQAETALNLGIADGTLDATRYASRAARAAYIANYGIFNQARTGLDLYSSGGSRDLLEQVVKAVAKSKTISPELQDQLARLTRGVSSDSWHRTYLTNSQTHTGLSAQADLLMQIGATSSNIREAVAGIVTGQRISVTDFTNVGPVSLARKFADEQRLARLAARKGPEIDIVAHMTRHGQLRSIDFSVPASMRNSAHSGAGFLLEHRDTHGRWAPVTGGFTDNPNVRIGGVLGDVVRQDGEGFKRLSGWTNIHQEVRTRSTEISYTIPDSLDPRGYRLPYEPAGAFSKSNILTDQSRWARRELRHHLKMTDNQIAGLAAGPDSQWRQLITQYDQVAHSDKIGRAERLLKDATEMFGRESHYTVTGGQVQLEPGMLELLGGTSLVFADDAATLGTPEIQTMVPWLHQRVAKYRRNREDIIDYSLNWALNLRDNGHLQLLSEASEADPATVMKLSTQSNRWMSAGGTRVAYVDMTTNKWMDHMARSNPYLSASQLSGLKDDLFVDAHHMSPDVESGWAMVLGDGVDRGLHTLRQRTQLIPGADAEGIPARPFGKMVNPGLGKIEPNVQTRFRGEVNVDGTWHPLDALIGTSEIQARNGQVEAIRQHVASVADPNLTSMYAQYMGGHSDISELERATGLTQLRITDSHTGAVIHTTASLVDLHSEWGFSTNITETGLAASRLNSGTGDHLVGGLSQTLSHVRAGVVDVGTITGLDLSNSSVAENLTLSMFKGIEDQLPATIEGTWSNTANMATNMGSYVGAVLGGLSGGADEDAISIIRTLMKAEGVGILKALE